MIQSVLAEERAITQDMKTRHLVHTWQDTDALKSVDKAPQPLSSRLHPRLLHRACAAPVWNRHLVNISKGGKPSQGRQFLSF